MPRLLIYIFSFLAGIARSQSSCQHSFIVYNADKGSELMRFSDAKDPPQYAVDQSKLAGISHLTLVASLCNNNPPFQSAQLSVYDLSDYVNPPGPRLKQTLIQGSPDLVTSGAFLKVPGAYSLNAVSYSQYGNKGMILDSMEVEIFVYRSCQKGFALYNTDKQTAIATFPDFGIGRSDVILGRTKYSTQGTLDLRKLGNTGLNMVAEFCNPLVKNVTFTSYAGKLLSVGGSPFALGPKNKTLLLPTTLLKTPTPALLTSDSYDNLITASAQDGIAVMHIFLNIAPPYQVLTFSLVYVNTGTTLTTSAVMYNDDIFSRTSHLELDLASFPVNSSFSIRANTVGTVKSVDFSLVTGPNDDAVGSEFTANQSPFALAGLSPSKRYNPVGILSRPGYYHVQATPYTGVNKSGKKGLVHGLFVSVLARTRVSNLTWVDVTNNSDIKVYTYPRWDLVSSPIYELDPLQYPANHKFTIRANPTKIVASVEFNLSRDDHLAGVSRLVYHHVQNNGPNFCLEGISSKFKGHCQASSPPLIRAPGSFFVDLPFNYRLSVTPFSRVNRQGVVGRTEEFLLNVLPPFKITKFIVVDATTGKYLLDPFTSPLDLSLFHANTTFAIRAQTSGSVGSVDFALSYLCSRDDPPLCTNLVRHVENGPPFSAAGVSSSTSPGRLTAIASLSVPGNYVLNATPYSHKNKRGYKGKEVSVQINVLARLRVDSFTMVDATTGTDIAIHDMVPVVRMIVDAISLSSFPENTKFSIRANTAGMARSVAFQLYQYPQDGTPDVLLNSTVDNQAPFALGGNTPSGKYQAVEQLSVVGVYGIVATPYSEANKGGDIGFPLIFNISVETHVTYGT